MSDIHPHWQSTPDDSGAGFGTAGRILRHGSGQAPAALPGRVHVSVSAASRLPAAVFGIIAVTLLGITLFGGWETMSAQVGGGSGSSKSASATSSPKTPLTPLEIRITSAGFAPASATAKPGQQITWTNEQSTPHILTSQTLRDGSGAYLNTPAIFPGGTASITLSPQEIPREHTVTSTTDQTLIGMIIVSSTPQAAASFSDLKQPLGSLDGVNLPSGQGSPAAGGNTSVRPAKLSKSSAKSSVVGAAAPVAGIPPPVSSGFDDFYAPVAPQPVVQPETGPAGVSVIALMSVAVLWGLTRKQFVKPAAA